MSSYYVLAVLHLCINSFVYVLAVLIYVLVVLVYILVMCIDYSDAGALMRIKLF